MDRTVDSKPDVKVRTLLPFVLISFAMTWGLAALLIWFPDAITEAFGEITASNPVFVLAVYSPGITGIMLVWFITGHAGLLRFLRRLKRWRMPVIWWLVLLLVIPVAFYTGAMLKGTVREPFPLSSLSQAVPLVLFAFFLGPVEEFGWRGLALPLLQRKLVPFWAGLVLGIIWAIWHLPAFLISGAPQSAWQYSAFFIGVVAISIVLTPMFNYSRGSLLVPWLYHFQMMNPIWPDAQPLDSAIFVGFAIITVWLNRASMFCFSGAVTEVVPA